jgi:site-specific DNA-methyltransferase (cytosine-N4-specific)
MSVYYSDDSVSLHHGDALDVLRTLPGASVDCCVTSPPYYGLRDYGSDGQYGLESSPDEYVETMRAVFAEVRRVLSDDGTLWLNIGDTYAGRANGGASVGPSGGHGRHDVIPKRIDNTRFAPYKSLIGMPWRVALAMIEDRWTLRQEIIWSKRTCMPEAVTDRPTRSHEQVFLFSKSPSYWFDADAIREDSDPDQVAHNERYAKVYAAQADRAATTGQPGNNNSAGVHARPGKPGRNARSVWHLSTTPFPAAHFATMPLTLAERAVGAGCKPGGLVLDPFSGSGTTGLAAARLGRRYVGIDLSAEYLDLSIRTRLAQPAFLDEEPA